MTHCMAEQRHRSAWDTPFTNQDQQANRKKPPVPQHTASILSLCLTTAVHHLPNKDLLGFTLCRELSQFSSKDVSCKTKSLQLHAQKVPRTCSTLTGPAAVYCWLEKSTEECKKPLISMFYHKRFPVSTVTSVATGVRVWQHSG